MKYLAFSRAPNYIASSLFEDETLLEYNVITLNEYDSVLRMKEVYDKLNFVIKKIEPSIVVTHSIELGSVMKKDLERLSEIKALIKLACIENKVVYIEARTVGWEKKILGRITKANKLKLLKEGYDIDLRFVDMAPYEESIADAIILGEAIAHRRLYT